MDNDFKKIIIRMPNWLGDAVMATPILADVKKRFPEAELTAMGVSPVADLLIGNPYLDEIFSFSRRNEFLRRDEKRDIIARLRQGKYDLGILLPNSFSSAWWFWRGRIDYRLGYASSKRSWLLTTAIPFPEERGKEHLVLTYKRLLFPLDIPLSTTEPQLYITEEERNNAERLLQRHHVPEKRTLIGINPGAAYGSAKCWPEKQFRALTCKLLSDPQTYILFFGDSASVPLIDSLCRDLPPRAINLAGATTIREAMACIAKCDVFLTNDSGPMHIAAALKTPLLALFGSTNPKVTGPYKHGEIIYRQVACSPCYKRTCPIDFRCMTRITVDEVYEALLKLHRKG